MNPVQFTKVVAFLLYLATIGFIYGIGRGFRDDFTAVTIVCVSFFFPGYMEKISGGLSQGFAYPLLACYLYFVSQNRVLAGSLVILVQSWFNPYIFTLSLVTHSLFVLHRQMVPWLFEKDIYGGRNLKGLLAIVGQNVPVLLGIMVMLLKYGVYGSLEFGETATWKDIEGNPEYFEFGRTDDLPPPSLFWELLVPWKYFFPFSADYPIAFYGCVSVVMACVVLALIRARTVVEFSGFRVFGYLLPASFSLYIVSYILLLRLFIPNRYVEFPFTIFYTVLLGVGIAGALRLREATRWASPIILLVIAVIGGVRNYNVSLYDYSEYKPIYGFIETLPKASLLAGHPDFMDNLQTFGRRKAFATYELSHPYRIAFWAVMKKRLYDFFDAYYAPDSQSIRDFTDYYGIDYLVVREVDFSEESLLGRPIYFEPFGTHVLKRISTASHFAALSESDFDIVYRDHGVRILRMRPRGSVSIDD